MPCRIITFRVSFKSDKFHFEVLHILWERRFAIIAHSVIFICIMIFINKFVYFRIGVQLG